MPAKKVEPIEYDAFRTGLTFRIVRQMLWVGSDDPRDWKYKRRGSVLGLWWQLKQQMYAEYLDRFEDMCALQDSEAVDQLRSSQKRPALVLQTMSRRINERMAAKESRARRGVPADRVGEPSSDKAGRSSNTRKGVGQ